MIRKICTFFMRFMVIAFLVVLFFVTLKTTKMNWLGKFLYGYAYILVAIASCLSSMIIKHYGCTKRNICTFFVIVESLIMIESFTVWCYSEQDAIKQCAFWYFIVSVVACICTVRIWDKKR